MKTQEYKNIYNYKRDHNEDTEFVTFTNETRTECIVFRLLCRYFA